MSRLSSRLESIRHLKTSQELRSLIGKPLAPCPDCGCAIRSVLQDGRVICEDCESSEGVAVALKLLCWTNQESAIVARDLADVDRERERDKWIDDAAYFIEESGKRWRVIITPECRQTIAERCVVAGTFET